MERGWQVEMAKAENWTRNTKWRSMPQRMLRSCRELFWQLHDILNGMGSVDEAEVIEADIKVAPSKDKLDKVAKKRPCASP